MSEFLNEEKIEEAAEGFWNKHKWCVIGGAVLFLAGALIF